MDSSFAILKVGWAGIAILSKRHLNSAEIAMGTEPKKATPPARSRKKRLNATTTVPGGPAM